MKGQELRIQEICLYHSSPQNLLDQALDWCCAAKLPKLTAGTSLWQIGQIAAARQRSNYHHSQSSILRVQQRILAPSIPHPRVQFARHTELSKQIAVYGLESNLGARN